MGAWPANGYCGGGPGIARRPKKSFIVTVFFVNPGLLCSIRISRRLKGRCLKKSAAEWRWLGEEIEDEAARHDLPLSRSEDCISA
jgi:hypothetical protein